MLLIKLSLKITACTYEDLDLHIHGKDGTDGNEECKKELNLCCYMKN